MQEISSLRILIMFIHVHVYGSLSMKVPSSSQVSQFYRWWWPFPVLVLQYVHMTTTDHSLHHMRLSYHFLVSAKYSVQSTLSMIDRSLAGFSQLLRPVLMRFEPRCMCSKTWSLMDIVGGATLECPSANIRSDDGPSTKSIGSLENFWPYGSSIPALQPYNISWAGGANTLKWSILALNFICTSFFALQSWEWQQHTV